MEKKVLLANIIYNLESLYQRALQQKMLMINHKAMSET